MEVKTEPQQRRFEKCKTCGKDELLIAMRNGECPTCSKITLRKLEKPRLQEKHVYFYQTNTTAGKLERHLKSKGIESIGNQFSRTLVNGDIVGSAFELKKEERVLRTLIVRNMEKSQIEAWHEYEKKHCEYLLCTTKEIFPIIKKKIIVEGWKMSNEFIDAVNEYNTKHLPQLPKYDGFTVVPWFIFDLSFDGMRFNHSWDYNVFYGEPIVFKPRGNKKDDQLQSLYD